MVVQDKIQGPFPFPVRSINRRTPRQLPEKSEETLTLYRPDFVFAQAVRRRDFRLGLAPSFAFGLGQARLSAVLERPGCSCWSRGSAILGTLQPFALASIKMVFRGLYHFSQAYSKGKADDPIVYLAEKARALAVLKAKRPNSLDAVALLTSQLMA